MDRATPLLDLIDASRCETELPVRCREPERAEDGWAREATRLGLGCRGGELAGGPAGRAEQDV